MLNQQSIFAADSGAARYIQHLDEQYVRLTGTRHHGDAAVHQSFVRVNFGWRQPQFTAVSCAGFDNARQNVLQLLIITDELQQRLILCAGLADTEKVFGRRIEF